MFTAAVFTIVSTWNKPVSLKSSNGEWTRKESDTYHTHIYSYVNYISVKMVRKYLLNWVIIPIKCFLKLGIKQDE